MSFAYSQTPIIRLLQSREYKTPKFWWRDQVTHNLRTYLADDTSTPAYKNNNFDAWRDSVMTVAVTLDDDGADVTAFRLDLVFDNDLFTWQILMGLVMLYQQDMIRHVWKKVPT